MPTASSQLWPNRGQRTTQRSPTTSNSFLRPNSLFSVESTRINFSRIPSLNLTLGIHGFGHRMEQLFQNIAWYVVQAVRVGFRVAVQGGHFPTTSAWMVVQNSTWSCWVRS